MQMNDNPTDRPFKIPGYLFLFIGVNMLKSYCTMHYCTLIGNQLDKIIFLDIYLPSDFSF